MKQGQAFGELALIKDQPRAATIKCREDCVFIVLNKYNYENIIGDMEERNLIMKANFLESLDLFSKLRRPQIESLTYYFQILNYTQNHVLYQENE